MDEYKSLLMPNYLSVYESISLERSGLQMLFWFLALRFSDVL